MKVLISVFLLALCDTQIQGRAANGGQPRTGLTEADPNAKDPGFWKKVGDRVIRFIASCNEATNIPGLSYPQVSQHERNNYTFTYRFFECKDFRLMPKPFYTLYATFNPKSKAVKRFHRMRFFDKATKKLLKERDTSFESS